MFAELSISEEDTKFRGEEFLAFELCVITMCDAIAFVAIRMFINLFTRSQKRARCMFKL